MKRLLKITFDLALFSFIPIFSWFVLSMLVDKNLINIFTLTYPIQFILSILRSVFSTGANICKEKDGNKNATMSGLVIGIIVGAIIFAILLFNIESYINFMNMDVGIYKEYAIYSVIQLYIQLVFSFILNKLYFEEKNDIANKYSFSFNLLNFVVLVLTALLTKNNFCIITITLSVLALYTIYVAIKSFEKFKLQFNLLNAIKYDSVALANSLAFFFIFLFGLSNAIDYGAEYGLAITFVALITDTQWDSFTSIITVAQIDISKNKFNYREHIRNAYMLLIILLITTLLMFIFLFDFYDLDLKITLILFSFELVNFLIYPVYRIKTTYLQLEYSALKTTTNKIISSLLRLFISLLPTPYCTGLGQVISSLYQFISINLMTYINFKINKNGVIEKKHKLSK